MGGPQRSPTCAGAIPILAEHTARLRPPAGSPDALCGRPNGDLVADPDLIFAAAGG